VLATADIICHHVKLWKQHLYRIKSIYLFLPFAKDVVRHLVVSEVEEVIPEALRDGGPDTEDLGDVLSSDHHVSVVKLDVHVRLLVH